MIYKIANTAEEYEQIFKLNYETFVEEIPQHEKNETKEIER
jgi:acetyltransferase